MTDKKSKTTTQTANEKNKAKKRFVATSEGMTFTKPNATEKKQK